MVALSVWRAVGSCSASQLAPLGVRLSLTCLTAANCHAACPSPFLTRRHHTYTPVGSLLSDAVPVLVLPDAYAATAAELCQLQQEEAEGHVPPGTAASVVRLVATVLRYLQRREAADAAGPGTAAAAAFAAAYPLPATVRLAAVAQRLSAMAVAARWPHLAALLLPAVTADGSPAAAAQQQLNALAAPAPTLLHLAVASGTAASVASLRAWACAQGYEWVAAPSSSQLAAAPLQDPLLLAAAMGSGLSEGMVQELSGA